MESHDIVAIATVAAGTILGAVEIYANHDGTILTAMVSLYALVLGYVFGRGSNQPTPTATESVKPSS